MYLKTFLLLSVAYCALADSTIVAPETVGLSSQRLGNIDTLMDAYINEKKMAGSVTLVARHGKIAYFKATGLADEGKPMQKDSIIIDKHLHGSINAHNIDGGVMFTITLPKIELEGESDA